MTNISTFLLKFRNDVFKLLPMREAKDEGRDNHLNDYLESLIFTAEGAVFTYSELENNKSYIYVVNNLNYLIANADIKFSTYRKIILNCTSSLDNLRIKYEEGE